MKTLRTRLGDAWKTPAIVALCVANAALGLSLVGEVVPGVAPAKAAMQGGRPGDYLMIPATLTTANQDIVYVIDTNTGSVTAAVYSRQNGLQFLEAPLNRNQVFGNIR